jgi:hypothetical protein
LATKGKKVENVTILLPLDEEFDTEVDEFVPIIVEEARGEELVRVVSKKKFRIKIGKREFYFEKDVPQYVTPSEEALIRKDGTRLY